MNTAQRGESSVYIGLRRTKTLVPVGPRQDPIGGLDKVFAKGIITPAQQKGLFVHALKEPSTLSRDIANAIVSVLRFAASAHKM